ncbi:MAG TPA: SMI1/KNR4 family protein [Candidatus Acidoferrum sp.]|nr:SMI1/KNR4 family protein [Candidatus Acidoferrum sp.]
MVDPLHGDLIGRIRQRAGDPATRTDAPPSTRGQTVTVGNLSVAGLDLGAALRGDLRSTPEGGAAALAPTASEATIADAERQLGFALPQPLRQLYRQVANGGFGPGAGIMPLEDVVSSYLELLATPPGRRGQKWPIRLLPVRRDDPGLCCVDVDNGEVIFWDEEELAAGASDKVWRRSFKPEAPDLGAWFGRWLDSPSPEQRTKDAMQKGMLDAIRISLVHWRAKTPEERAAFGLPEKGWEEKLFGHLGIDLSKL